MPDERFEERTEPATPRRREEARERGHVARSPDLSNAIILLAALLALYYMGPVLGGTIARTTAYFLSNPADSQIVDERDGWFVLVRAAGGIGGAILPFLGVVAAAALAAHWLQVGFLFTTETMGFSLERLDVVAGFQRFFTTRGLVKTGMGLAKLAVLLGVAGWTIWSQRYALLGAADMEFPQAFEFVSKSILILGIRIAIALLLLAILDYAYQRFQYERDLRMSKQEVKEELKRYEGDPKIRERRRRVQMQLALQRMLGRVPKATVVITNPTEYAVALQYDKENPDKTPAPVVVAKGRGRLAERIRTIAHENDVPVVRKPELARAIYATVEVDQAIPPELYEAVAEVLALVYRMKPVRTAVPA